MPLTGVALGLAICAGSLGPPQTVALTYKSFVGCAGRYSYAAFEGSFEPSDDAAGRPDLPAGAVQPHYFELYRVRSESAGPIRPLYGVVAKSSAKARTFDTMWVDWKSNGKFDSDECAVLGAAQGGMAVFVPKKQPAIEGVRVPIRYRLAGDDVIVEPAGYREGVARISGRKVKLAVVNGGLDGLFSSAGESNLLLIDYKGSGSFENGLGDVAYREYGGDSAPLDGEVLMPDKSFYQVRVSPSGRNMVLQQIHQPMGAISIKGGEVPELSLSGPHGQIVTRPMGGALPVPAGTYRVSHFCVSRGDWACGLAGPGPTVTVRAGKTLRIGAGLPVKLALTVQARQRQISFGAEAKTASGVAINGIYAPNGDRPPPPTVSVRDGKGRVVKGLALEYG